jgi:hypothetical protein
LPSSNLFAYLFTAAEAYFSLGYAVIPLHGDADPARAKVAAVPWKAYQQAKPGLAELRDWFSNDSVAALGIVTGAVSRLVVLDFDTPDLFRAFQSRFPDLAQNHVVATRRGFHIYFRLPPNLNVPSRKGQDIDLLSDGCYVVARPSTIAGHTYKLVKGGQPHKLSVTDLHSINAFIDGCQFPVASSQHSEPSSSAALYVHDMSCPYVSPSSDSVLSPQSSAPLSLPSLYRYLAAKGEGRNRALFIASIAARDHGWALEKTLETLVDLHVAQRTSGSHLPESSDMRRHEAEQTIRSAYTRLARPLRQYRDKRSGEQGGANGLPNSVREELLARKLTTLIRLWEGLYAKSIVPSTVFTAAEAVNLLKGIVGRDSIYNGLGISVNGEPLFERQSPSGHPQASSDAAMNTENGIPKKCVFGRAEKPGINPKGRPTRRFVMPAPLDWCRILGVEPMHSDPLTVDDLGSAKKTRMATHRELIKRRPGKYPRRWLARRLGVRVETLDTYNHEIPIHSRPQFIEKRIYWSNIHLVPDDMQIGGAFLEDATGKRYPAKRAIAARLLRQGTFVTYKRQDANYYWYGDCPPDLGVTYGLPARADDPAPAQLLSISPVQGRTDQFDMPARTAFVGTGLALSASETTQIPASVGTRYISSAPSTAENTGTTHGSSPTKILSPEGLMTASSTPQQPAFVGARHVVPTFPTTQNPPGATAHAASPKSKRLPTGRRRLNNAVLESRACRVTERVNRRTDDAALHIGLASARKLVSQYDRALIDKTLGILESRANVSKPAGFFVTVLRSEAKRKTLLGGG